MRQTGDLCAACVRRHPQSVIVSHHAFYNGDITVPGTPAQILPQLTLTAEKTVQIAAVYSQHFPVIERIDIVGTAFERRRAQAFPLQEPQKAAGDGRLSAAASRSCDHQSWKYHVSFSMEMTQTGFCAFIM